MSKPVRRILSAVVEPTICVVSCNLSAAGNASRIWRAASLGESACKMEIPGGLRVASLGFNRKFAALPPPMRCLLSDSVLGTFSLSFFPFLLDGGGREVGRQQRAAAQLLDDLGSVGDHQYRLSQYEGRRRRCATARTCTAPSDSRKRIANGNRLNRTRRMSGLRSTG